MADITVKNSTNVDIIFTALTPAGADGTPAQWRVATWGATPDKQIRLEVKSRNNATKSGRKVEAFIEVPYVETIAGTPTVVSRVPIRLEATVPFNVPSGAMLDLTIIATNAFAAALMRSVISSGYAPN